jgi:hypothetical protein
VAEVPFALCTVHFGPLHAELPIRRLFDGVLERREKAGPASSAFEFAVGREKILTASGALEDARPMLVI